MTPSLSPNGSWSATLRVPSYLGGSATRGPGAPTTPGPYEFAVPASCLQSPSPLTDTAYTVTPGRVPSVPQPAYVGIAPTPTSGGYWLAESNGDVTSYGNAVSYGSLTTLGVTPASPIVGIAATADGEGYWLVAADGGVFGFGDAKFYGSLPASGITPAGPITGIAATPSGDGYWLLGADGGVFSFGNAAFAGTISGLPDAYDAISPTPTGGYVVSASTNAAVYTFPGGTRSGGALGTVLDASLVGTAVVANGTGTWQAGLDGGVFTSGDAPFYGSLPGEGIKPAAPISAIATTSDGGGYWLLGTDGGVFSFGDATFFGSGTA
jgi:hypothetical protein